MIIQCKQCRTKFKFDDALMQGSGVWLRCSRCGHVYFQENPLLKPETDLPSDLPSEHVPVFSEEVMPAEKSVELSTESSSIVYRDADGFHSIDKVMEAKKYLNEEINLDIEKTPEESISGENEEVEQTEYFEWKEQNLLREYIKDADDEIVFEKKYTYNSDGTHLLETYLHDKLSEKESRVFNEYDEKGNKSLTKLYDNKNRLLSRTTYFVNEKNEVTQIIEEEGLNKTVIYLDYDERGNIIKEEDYSSNEILTARFEQKYNENNMLIEYTAFIDKQGEGSNQSYVLTYEYTFFE